MKQLSEEEKKVIEDKGTEPPFTGKYVFHHGKGIYECKKCGANLFSSASKFDSNSGWPSFDEALPGALKEVPDEDGMRVEIQCANCNAHLGHVFRGEWYTSKNARFCVNSIALDFQPQKKN